MTEKEAILAISELFRQFQDGQLAPRILWEKVCDIAFQRFNATFLQG